MRSTNRTDTEAPCQQRILSLLARVLFLSLDEPWPKGGNERMYPQIKHPKKVTEKWLNRAFAPLRSDSSIPM